MISETLTKQDVAMKHFVRAGAGVLLALALLLIGTLNLERTPPVWWDEGWTLTVARNWVERGHYGRFLDGEPASPGLAASFPVIAPIALSFRLFGVGVWQARLVGVFFTLGALALIYYLACRLYDRSVGLASVAVVVLMSPHPAIHPILMGRQVLGEMPMLFYLLAGYACFLSALRKSLWFMPVVVGLWGIALNTKAQAWPFWMASLLIPLSVMLFKRRWRSAGLLVIALFGSLIASELLLWLQQLLLHGREVARSPIIGLYDVTAFVPIAIARLRSGLVTLLFGLPTMLGLCYATGKFMRSRDTTGWGIDCEVVRLALLALAGSWFAWYVLLSVGWPRYLFPATFIGSIFVAKMLRDLTDHFSLSSTIKRPGYALRHLRLNWQSAGTMLVTLLITITFLVTSFMLYQNYVVGGDASALQVAQFLNTQTAPDALVETYDSELFLLLDRRYHYPPDQVHVQLNRRTFLREDVLLTYNPLGADPDYLVIGPHSKLWQLYNPVLATGAFRLLRAYSRYDVYERVR